MSKKIAAAFIEKARTDGAFQQKLFDLGPDTSVAALLEVADGLGFQFTENDLFEAAKSEAEARMARGEELSEIELETVAGGNQTIVGVKNLLAFIGSAACMSHGCKTY